MRTTTILLPVPKYDTRTPPPWSNFSRYTASILFAAGTARVLTISPKPDGDEQHVSGGYERLREYLSVKGPLSAMLNARAYPCSNGRIARSIS